MSIASEILRIQQAKQAIKESINDKGGTLTNESIDDYAQAIDNLPSDGYAYEDYARTLYLALGKLNQFTAAWEHSLTVNPSQIGMTQYPNGETEGVIIPQGVTIIGNNAFDSWVSNNQPLVIPNSVTSIGNNAFSNWGSNNQPLVIPNSVTSIDIFSFSNWTSNNQPLVIPNSVTNIGAYAFNSWALVPYVEIQAITPPTITNVSFSNTNSAPIYVPDGSVDDYKTATNWAGLADRIFSINDK